MNHANALVGACLDQDEKEVTEPPLMNRAQTQLQHLGLTLTTTAGKEELLDQSEPGGALQPNPSFEVSAKLSPFNNLPRNQYIYLIRMLWWTARYCMRFSFFSL